MKLHTLAAAALTATLMLGAVAPVQAQDRPRNYSSLYYRIGGAEPGARPSNRNSVAIRLGVGGNARLNYSCGRFDIGLSWSNFMNGISRLGAQLTSGIQAGIAALPMYAMQRAMPGLYDLFQKYSQKAEVTVNAALKTCEQMEAEMQRPGGDPYEAYRKLANGQGWKIQASTNGDIIDAKTQVEDDAGRRGMTWIGGRQHGGAGQPPIRLIRDLVSAGYNVTMNQAPLTPDSAFSGATTTMLQSRLMQSFARPSDAARYATDVLGDMEVSTCDTPTTCPAKATSTGVGLAPKFEAEIPPLETAFAALVGPPTPDYSRLNVLSAPGVAISREVIDAIRELPGIEQSIVQRRLTQEIALARTIDKALAVRNLLVASLTLPEVTAAEPATTKAQEKIAVLNRYIEDMMFENRVRKELVSNTSELLIEARRGLQTQSLSTPLQRRADPAPLRDGRVE